MAAGRRGGRVGNQATGASSQLPVSADFLKCLTVSFFVKAFAFPNVAPSVAVREMTRPHRYGDYAVHGGLLGRS